MAGTDAETIDLAHSPDFTLGRLSVRPSVRQLVRDDGENEVLEPRVMQVLLALVRANGAIVTRDELTRFCWEGRIVGEDAINRVISRLRRSAEGIGDGSFRIETITKVGYRLLHSMSGETPVSGATRVLAASRKGLSRRMLVGGALTAGGAAVVSSVMLWSRHHASPSPQVQDLMVAGMSSLGQTTADGELQARGMFRRVTQLAPDYAHGWGALAMIYSLESHFYAPAQADASRARARELAERALTLDPDDSLARAAKANLLPFNRWLEIERVLRDVLRQDPTNSVLLQWLGRHMARVGRMGEAADSVARAVATMESSAVNMFDLMTWQWAAGRLDDAEQSIERAMQLFPRNFAVWFGVFFIKMYTGKVEQAIAMAQDVANRPATIRDEEVESVLAVAEALRSRDPAAMGEQARIWLDKAHHAAGYAENAMQFLATFGRRDEAFAVADAYFLNRGWSVPSIRFPRGQGSYTVLADRRTNFLFTPSVRALWHDPRFDALVDALGLVRYWKESGTSPDYRRL